MKIFVTLIAILKLTRFIKGQGNPFKPSFGFRGSINDTSLTFGLNDQLIPVSDLLGNNQQSRTRPDIPSFPSRSRPVKPKTLDTQRNVNTINKQNRKHRTRPNIKRRPNVRNFPIGNIQTKPNVPNFPKQETNTRPNIPDFPKSAELNKRVPLVSGSSRSVPRTPNSLRRRKTFGVKSKLFKTKRKNGVTNRSSLKQSKNSAKNIHRVKKLLNNNVKLPIRSTSGAVKEDISSIETVKEGLNVANMLTSQISEDAIRKKFIDFFIKNSKKPKKSPKEKIVNKGGMVEKSLERANPLPPISSTESRFNMGPLSQITDFVNDAASNSSEPDAPMTFFIGPLLVPAHVIEHAKEDQNGRNINTPLIALPFGPNSQNGIDIAPSTVSHSEGNTRRQVISSPGNVRGQSGVSLPLVTQPENLPLVRSPNNPALPKSPSISNFPEFRRSHSDIQRILDASFSGGAQRRNLNTQTAPSSRINRPTSARRRSDGVTITRTRVRRPLRNGFTLNSHLVPLSVAQQAVRAFRRRNQISRQSGTRSGIPGTVVSSRPISLQQALINQNSRNFVNNAVLHSSQTTRQSAGSNVETQPNGPTSPEINHDSVFSSPLSNQNSLSADLSQSFIDPTQLSANELAQMSQQNEQNIQNNFQTLPVQTIQSGANNIFDIPTLTTQNVNSLQPSIGIPQFNTQFQDTSFQRQHMTFQPLQNSILSRTSNSPFRSLQPNFNGFQGVQRLNFPGWV